MNDREKLVDLMADIIDFVDWEHLEETADYLIANGVIIQKQGEWIPVEDFDGEYHWQCTACKCEWWFEAGEPSENGVHYCPNCGAFITDIKFGKEE